MQAYRFATTTIKTMILCFLITSCANTPTPLNNNDVKIRIEEDKKTITVEQESIDHPITVWEAMARAIKYNLDHRVKQMEIALAQRIEDVSHRSLLPTIALQAGYSVRNNYSGGISQSLITGRQSLEPSTSQEKGHYTAGLRMAWNVLDYTINRLSAEQASTEVFIAQERRRRVIHNVLGDVQDAYWQALVAQNLLDPVNTLLADAQAALKKSRTLESRAIQNPEIALQYQKRLLETLRQLFKLREELSLAKIQLATLINIPPGTEFELAVPDNYPEVPELNINLTQLENYALQSQPELREEDYLKRIGLLEVKKSIRRMYPSLELSLGMDYDDNKFLYNQNWMSAGIDLSWNLMNAFVTGPASTKEKEANVALADSRRVALGMAVLTQVWVSYQSYKLSLEDFDLAQQLYQVNHRLNDLAKKGRRARARSQLDVIFVRANALVSHMDKDITYAAMRSSLGRIYRTIGLDPLPNLETNEDIETLAALIQKQVKVYGF